MKSDFYATAPYVAVSFNMEMTHLQCLPMTCGNGCANTTALTRMLGRKLLD